MAAVHKKEEEDRDKTVIDKRNLPKAKSKASYFKLQTTQSTSLILCVVFVLLAIFACNQNASWMPLNDGNAWKYNLYDKMNSKVVEIKVNGETRVGDGKGTLLSGNHGSTKLAWRGGKLYVSDLATMSFDPPLIMLQPGQPKSQWKYEGEAKTRFYSETVNAIITQEPNKYKISETEFDCLQVKIFMKFQDQEIEQITYYSNNIGIIRQEQRNNGEFVYAMDWISGP